MKYKVLALSVLFSISAISFNASAEVDFTGGNIVGQASDGKYSVKLGDSVWHGIEASEVTSQQIKSYQMTKALEDAKKNPVPVSTPKPTTTPFVNYRGGNNQSDNHSHSEHGTGNGSNNAANSNSAHGLGGGDHIGGGRSGGGYHY